MIRNFIQSLLGKKQAAATEPAPKPVYKDRAAIELKVREIVAGELSRDLNDVTLETNSFEEGDSVGNVEIIMCCEEVFGIEIPDEDAARLPTVDAIVRYVQAKLGL